MLQTRKRELHQAAEAVEVLEKMVLSSLGLGDLSMQLQDNFFANLAAVLVLVLAGAVHVLDPTASTVAVVADMLGFTIQSGSLAAIGVRIVGVGVVLKGLAMADMLYR